MIPLGTLSLFGACVAAGSDLPTATIDAGPIVGTTTSFASSSTTVNKFLGVPFAAPPKRFMPAETPEPWTEPLDTKTASPACIQQFRGKRFPVLTPLFFSEDSYVANTPVDPEDYRKLFLDLLNNPAPEESEDCLYLNIYAPASRTPSKERAVMFWIFGGGLFSGHASHPLYDGSHLAAYEDVIVVAPNYRTNSLLFPFLSHPLVS